MSLGLVSDLARKIPALALMLGTLCVAPALAAPLSDLPTTNTWVANGTVYAIARTSSTIYIGGDFTHVGPATGGCVPLSAATGEVPALFPKVFGRVYACVSDRAGGWFIGGLFNRVGDLRRYNLAHILADGGVDPTWDPQVTNVVYALALSGGVLYIGGGIYDVDGQSRSAIAALDAATGEVTDWKVTQCFWTVYAIAVANNTVYVGGDFETFGGLTRHYLAAVDTTSGEMRPWDPDVRGPGYGATIVRALAVAGNTVYVGGCFNTVGGKARKNIAAVDATTGKPTDWDPQANYDVQALAVSDGVVYAGGYFDRIGGEGRDHIAALDAVSGAVKPWYPYANKAIMSLTVSGGRIYAGGEFTFIGGQERNHLAALDLANGAAAPWNPNVNAVVNAIAVSGGTICAGGGFTSVGGQSRNRIAALDAATGAATVWNPDADKTVSALAVAGGKVYAGGSFSVIGRMGRPYLAALDAATGMEANWPTAANGAVKTLAISGDMVYAGGDFTSIGGKARNRIAALDRASGQATAWNPNANGAVKAMAITSGTIYAGGQFTAIGGQTRNYLAALDLTSGTATAWDPNPNRAINALAASSGTVYAGGEFTTIGGQARKYLAALDVSGAATPWNPNPNMSGSFAPIHALAVSNRKIYVGGFFNNIGGQWRMNLGEIDKITGTATSWNPQFNFYNVYALAIGGGAVWAGGDFAGYYQLLQTCFVQFDPTLPPAAPCHPGATALQPNRITWIWSDTSDDEAGFKIWADPGMTTPTTLRASTAEDDASWIYGGLTPNTQYAFQAAATNAAGDSLRTSIHTTFTLAAAPAVGGNVLPSSPVGVGQPLGTTFSFSNPVGFGSGTHGGGAFAVSAFRYAWDDKPTHAFSGDEALWNAGSLAWTPTEAGRSYLHLQAINAAGAATPQTLDLGPFNVGLPATFTTQPTGQTINPGDSVTFTVAASGTAPLAYQWRCNGVLLNDGARIVGATSSTLRLDQLTAADGGYYDCMVSNLGGTTTSTTARLVVNPTLTISSPWGSPAPSVGTCVLTTGTMVTASMATPVVDVDGYTRRVCTGWMASGAAPASGMDSSFTFILDQPTSITWQWKNQFMLAAAAVAPTSGTVTLADGVTSANGSWHDEGASVMVRALPMKGWVLGSWSGNVRGRQNPTTLIIQGPSTAIARFAPGTNGIQCWSQYE